MIENLCVEKKKKKQILSSIQSFFFKYKIKKLKMNKNNIKDQINSKKLKQTQVVRTNKTSEIK